MAGAYQTGIYRNVLKECGYDETAIGERLEQTFETIFYGTEAQRFYHEAGGDMAYLEDTGNHDVRTEGMSYGMMVCVQMDKKAEFDRLWKWVRTYMYIPAGPCRNYFAWSCREFWRQAAAASREYLHKACHPQTGLSAEYADYDGTPHAGHQEIFGKHDWYYSDAYRTIANIAMDHLWYDKDPWQTEIANRLQRFYCEEQREHWDGVFLIDGTRLEEKALHPVAIVAVNAQASLAADGPHIKECVDRFWNTPLRTGDRRYYDNFLYLFAMLALSGNYRIYK